MEGVEQMSWNGVRNIRLQPSLLSEFKARADQQGITYHEAGRCLVEPLQWLTQDELLHLPEPPREARTERISLYLGDFHAQLLDETTYGTALTISSIFRRLIYGLFVAK